MRQSFHYTMCMEWGSFGIRPDVRLGGT